MSVASGTAADYPLGTQLDEGKTKKIFGIRNDPSLVALVAKDDLTAGDGAKHDILAGKAAFANETACNALRLLKDCDLPVAFERRLSAMSLLAPKCAMLPYEVVARREAHGSYLKRNPHMVKGHLFPKLVVELYLKTKNRSWKDHRLVCDDPFMTYVAGSEIKLFDPSKPIHGQAAFLTLRPDEVFSMADEAQLFPEMVRLARQAFLVLERAWQLAGGRLVDFKVEFGIDTDGQLRLADVVDNDSWRVLRDGANIDKQVYREGGALDVVTENYRQVAEITRSFRLPKQQVVIWTGSEKDNTAPIVSALEASSGFQIAKIVCSAHKEPIRAVSLLSSVVQAIPNSVVIALIGRSNGAGPVLAANTTVPVITVPADVKSFPEDVWSSLRMPSSVPVLTVLEPSNAAQAALQFLAARNPRIYADLRGRIEERALNVVEI
ncbi:MAG: AIR carboxylase family protein [Rhizobiales bacterium]|nr:AIR carboxylase family protein [Hyphomicrobiales bacterium]